MRPMARRPDHAGPVTGPAWRCDGWGRVLVLSLLLMGALSNAQPIARSDASQFEGLLTGRVCRDLNGDGRCGSDEPGQPGVRLVLATGQEVRSDRSGRFDVAGLSANRPEISPVAGATTFSRVRHRLRVDVRSLPAGLT